MTRVELVPPYDLARLPDKGLRSERQLIDIASLNLGHRWYIGYNLDEPLPDHSSLPRIRHRLGLPADCPRI